MRIDYNSEGSYKLDTPENIWLSALYFDLCPLSKKYKLAQEIYDAADRLRGEDKEAFLKEYFGNERNLFKRNPNTKVKPFKSLLFLDNFKELKMILQSRSGKDITRTYIPGFLWLHNIDDRVENFLCRLCDVINSCSEKSYILDDAFNTLNEINKLIPVFEPITRYLLNNLLAHELCDDHSEIGCYKRKKINQILSTSYECDHEKLLSSKEAFRIDLNDIFYKNRIYLKDYYEQKKKETDFYLNIIHQQWFPRHQNYDAVHAFEDKYLKMDELKNGLEDRILFSNNGCFSNEYVRKICKDLTAYVGNNILHFFNELYPKCEIIPIQDCKLETMFIFRKGVGDVYLICYDEFEKCPALLLLSSDVQCFLIPHNEPFRIEAKISRFRRREELDEDYILNEAIKFDKDGGFKFLFKPKQSYMDEYANNHKVLVQNHKNKNIEGMKTNLAFAFYLIDRIEKDVMYSDKKISPEVKRDAEKARAFAINDFKTYLAEVQKYERGFNFTKYYENSDMGKTIIEFTGDEISGIKKLFFKLLAI